MAVLALISLVLVTSCGEQPRPLGEWEIAWFDTTETVSQSAVPGTSVNECEEVLAYLRDQRLLLTPVPIDDLEEPVDSYFSETESLFFDCEFEGPRAEHSLETIEALQAEVETVLRLEG